MTEKLNKYKNALTGAVLSVGLFVTGVGVNAETPDYPGDATTALDSMIADIADVLFTGLTSAMALIGALIGLFFIIRLIRKWISRGK
jgi:hypothetical protein